MPQFALKNVMYYITSLWSRPPQTEIQILTDLCRKLTKERINNYSPIKQGVARVALFSKNAEHLLEGLNHSIEAILSETYIDLSSTQLQEPQSVDSWACTEDGKYYPMGQLLFTLKEKTLLLNQHYTSLATTPATSAKADYYRIKIRPLVLDLTNLFTIILK